MATKVEIAKEYNYRVAARMEAGMDVTREVSMGKNFACETCDKVCFDAVQIHGGYGYAGNTSSSGCTAIRGSSASAAGRRKS
jgi:alkylation response protein AidB-like acyl-CoA dehydrogenase